MQPAKRKAYLDILRILAIFLVLYCHTGAEGIHYYQVAESTKGFWASLILATGNHLMIPLFFMISGVLLLGNEESFGEVFRKRVLRMVIVLIGITIFQYLWNVATMEGMTANASDFLRALYEGSAATPLWYLYAYISYLIMLPTLQRLARVLPDEGYYIIFALYVITTGLCPLAETVLDWNTNQLALPGLAAPFVYALTGYFIAERGWPHMQKWGVRLGVYGAGLALFLINLYCNRRLLGGVGMQFDVFILPYAVVVFVLVKSICERHEPGAGLAKVLAFASEGVFGVYLFEGQLRRLTHPVYEPLRKLLGPIPAALLWVLAAGIVGMAVFGTLKKLEKVIFKKKK